MAAWLCANGLWFPSLSKRSGCLGSFEDRVKSRLKGREQSTPWEALEHPKFIMAVGNPTEASVEIQILGVNFQKRKRKTFKCGSLKK